MYIFVCIITIPTEQTEIPYRVQSETGGRDHATGLLNSVPWQGHHFSKLWHFLSSN